VALRKPSATMPHLALDLGYTDTGLPFVSVTVPGAGFDDAPPIITRGERGWQMPPGWRWATVCVCVGAGGRGVSRVRAWVSCSLPKREIGGVERGPFRGTFAPPRLKDRVDRAAMLCSHLAGSGDA